jgi:hypothetical protein
MGFIIEVESDANSDIYWVKFCPNFIYKDFGEIICMWSMCLILKDIIVMLIVWEVMSWNTDNIEIQNLCSLGRKFMIIRIQIIIGMDDVASHNMCYSHIRLLAE